MGTWRKQKYGLVAQGQVGDWDIERVAWMVAWPSACGGLGTYEHFKRWVTPIWPQVDWNPWFELIQRACCNDAAAHVQRIKAGPRIDAAWAGMARRSVRVVSMTGCAAAGKTYAAAFHGCAWWRADPENSAVILCSTEKDMVRRRQWPVITGLHQSALNPITKQVEVVGHLIDSRTRIVARKGDDAHGIFALAVKGSETQNAVAFLKGIHAPRIMLIIDEAEATPEAIFEVIPNLRKGCDHFFVIVIGNSVSHLDPHGLCCEPRQGWNSITVESESWPTKGVGRYQIDSGVCLHFDGEKSPNVTGRRTRWPYLYTWEDYRAAQDRPEFQDSVQYWSHDRGFWAPEGASDRLFTEIMFQKYDGYGKFTFLLEGQPVAFLDSAFGGDECKVVFGRLGDLGGGKLGLQILEVHEILVSATENDERDYQIARTVIEWCRQRGVSPECFGDDATGIGRGVHAIIAGEWSAQVQRVEWVGAPSSRPSSTADSRPATEVYTDYCTELWWSVRELLQAGQIRGFYQEAVVQFCARRYEMRGRKYRMESKAECKARLKRSPDDADAIAGLVEVCRRLGLVAATPAMAQADQHWEDLRDAANDVAAPQASLYEHEDEADQWSGGGSEELEACDLSL